ncbi:MAG: hypothetical protein II072_01270 [Clostridia bacterium]|nr:hypothetical protein [Clostridia bacterium]MBQ2110922.1 hypothetical protein [Clostridia bacterium]
MKKRRTGKMPDGEIRIMKLGKEAIIELLYETVIGEQEHLFNVDPNSVMDHWSIDFENGQFIFCVTNENEYEKTQKLDFQKIMKELPETTDSVFNGKTAYRSFKLTDLMNK